MNSAGIPLFLDETYLSHGITKWVLWDIKQAPHGLVVGQSGSGKTYACKQILAHTHIETNCEVYVLDYKADTDFDCLIGCMRLFRYTACRNGLHEFYNRFQKRQSGNDTERYPLLLFFDEWSSYCNAMDKKQSEEDKKILGILVSLGRSFRCHVIISQQRADAVYFNQFRDNFSMCIGMGNLSDESRKMLFPDYAKELLPDRQRGTGYTAINGQKPVKIMVPPVKNPFRLERILQEAVGK